MKPLPTRAPRKRLTPRDSELGYWLQLSADRAALLLRGKLEAAGVTLSESILLRELYRMGPASPTLLGPAIGMTKGAVSKIINQLHKKGLVARGIVEEDHRHHALTLTRKGLAVVPEIARITDAHEAEFFGHLPRRQRTALLRALQALSIAVLTLALGIGGCQTSNAQKTPFGIGSLAGAQVTVYAKGLDAPWGLAFLPDGRALVTERPGRLRLVSTTGALSEPISGVPTVVASGQGGLLDVAIGPDQRVYLSYAEAGPGGVGTAVARGTLTGTGLENVEVIWRQRPKVSGGNHFGSRLVFARDGTLFITTGERFQYRDSAQSLTNTLGKVIRINPDGSIPPDNPFVGRKDALPEIWSYGHRNMQGATLHPETGQLWTIEHGAQGGDELNLDLAGRNYGWPVITWGIDYSGDKIGEGTTKAGMEQPVWYWVPSIAPSGLVYYTGDAFPQWRGSFFVGALKWQGLSRIEVSPDGTVKEERFQDPPVKRRIRNVRQGPDGALYLLVDSSDGEILRISSSP